MPCVKEFFKTIKLDDHLYRKGVVVKPLYPLRFEDYADDVSISLILLYTLQVINSSGQHNAFGNKRCTKEGKLI